MRVYVRNKIPDVTIADEKRIGVLSVLRTAA
jgi:hypothetical protein